MLTAESVHERLFDALLAGDRERAFRIVDEARDNGLPLRDLYLHVFQPALRRVGECWQENRITVAEEHLATAITQAAMARLYTKLFDDADIGGRTVLAACAENERHEVGLRMVCDLLEMAGWDTTFLGSSVPARSLAAMVRARRPDVLALSASTTPRVTELRAAIAAVREAIDYPLIIAVGGIAFNGDEALGREIGADLVIRDAGDAVDRLAALATP